MMYFWEIEKIIKETLQELKLSLSYEIDNQLKAPMSFNISTNTIKFNYIQINQYKGKMNVRLKETNENFVKLMLYREIGYYLDFKKNKHDLRTLMYGGEEEKKQLMKLIEKNAWVFGRTLVPEELLGSYDKLYELDKMFSG
ncbi:hypothetical protein E2R51_17495 [Jeotgalibacillus sp. S-D1]|uniref:hypothetical protein n=1 Tax=Jeotgalibacillus sp. S-D1 TaxID=2552189 RepID=UPI00105A0EF8|nr:hypothetical protein [Jeotgalibacillus sp. S-D1]TDL30593.1 hypothetical protein E2R51_17495 [Jeotgalibacillus sp. S-D1]